MMCAQARCTRREESSHSPALHEIMPRIPASVEHVFGCSSSRIMARIRTGCCSVASFLHRHGLKGDDTCDRCGAVEDVSHHFRCPELSAQHQEVWNDFQEIMDCADLELLQVLSVKLMLGLQIRIANATENHLEKTTEFGML